MPANQRAETAGVVCMVLTGLQDLACLLLTASATQKRVCLRKKLRCRAVPLEAFQPWRLDGLLFNRVIERAEHLFSIWRTTAQARAWAT
jgi:hypothetical protein